MKRLLITTLAFALTGCAPRAPTPPPASLTAVTSPTPVVVVQTVLVTVIPTEKPTDVPTFTAVPPPSPTPQIAAPSSQAATTGTAGGASPTATLPANAGGDLFANLTRSTDHFALRCQPDTITFGLSTSNVHVRGVDLYYRIEDRLSVSISQWNWGGSMVSDKHGNFTLDFPASWVDKDMRSHRAWFDYQFVGLNKVGEALGRSAKIVKQIAYTIECSD